MTALTDHAKERSRERLGLSTDAALRLAARALERGVRPAAVKGSARRWIDGVALDQHCHPVVYGEYVYIFSGDDRLITVYAVPRSLRDAFRRASK